PSASIISPPTPTETAMPRQRFMILPAVLLLAALAALPACKKNKSDDGGGGGGDGPGPGPTPPAVVGSQYVLSAQLKAKDIFDSAVFAEVKQAVDKAGGTAEWDKA